MAVRTLWRETKGGQAFRAGGDQSQATRLEMHNLISLLLIQGSLSSLVVCVSAELDKSTGCDLSCRFHGLSHSVPVQAAVQR
jgi:hypothetical protein